MNNFDPELAIDKIETLCGLIEKVNSDMSVDTWQETTDQIWGLLDAMELHVNHLSRYFAEKGRERIKKHLALVQQSDAESAGALDKEKALCADIDQNVAQRA